MWLRGVGRPVRAVAASAAAVALSACGVFDVDSGSVTSMVGAFRADQAPLGQYFSFDRYAAGADVDLDGPKNKVLDEVFVQRSADPTVSRPLAQALASPAIERPVIGVSSVDATYEQPGTSGATLLRGEFDVDQVTKRLEAALRQQRDKMVGAEGASEPPNVGPPQREGAFTRLTVEGFAYESDVDRDTSLAVSEDTMVLLPSAVPTSQVLVEDRNKSRLRSKAVREVAAVLDDAEVYAAVLSFEAVTFEGGEPALAGGFGTGLVDGGERSFTVLAHDSDRAVTANIAALKSLMGNETGCDGPVEVTVKGRVAVASCRSDGATWGAQVLDGLDASGPFTAP